ncbi:MAG: hypothetical protein ACXW1W_02190 [Methylococcaceae bacterium]
MSTIDRTTGKTTRVSVSSTGAEQADGFLIRDLDISADGRFVVFTSDASNLTEDDTNGAWDVFVHDRVVGATQRVSISSSGEQGIYISHQASISDNGRFIVFLSSNTNFVTGDNNEKTDIFVHDRVLGATTLASLSSDGLQGNDHSSGPTISADGRFVGFTSIASNFVDEDTNGLVDVFIHNRISGKTTRINVDSQGNQQLGNFHAGSSAISADGRFVGFNTGDSNLVAGDSNGNGDIFVRDRQLNPSKTAELQIAVTSQPASVQTGQTASYIYALTNNGPDSINTEVKLTDVIANGRVISLTPSQGFCSTSAVSVCRFGALAVGRGAPR